MMHTTQVREAPTSVRELRSPRNRKAIRRFILERYLNVGQQKMVVAVIRKREFSTWLRQSGLPDNILIEDLDMAPDSLYMAAALERYEADLSIWALIEL